MILLTSDGLSSDALLTMVHDEVLLKKYEKACVVVTADKRFKKKSKSAKVLQDQLLKMNLEVFLFDYDTDDQTLLKDVDVIVFDGGNPFFLLLKLKQYKTQSLLKKFVEDDKLLIGVSGGSLVLQKTLSLIDVFAPDMNMRHGGDLKGLGFVDVEMLPHKTRYTKNFNNFIHRCKMYEIENNVNIHLVEDGEGLVINHGIITTITND